MLYNCFLSRSNGFLYKDIVFGIVYAHCAFYRQFVYLQQADLYNSLTKVFYVSRHCLLDSIILSVL